MTRLLALLTIIMLFSFPATTGEEGGGAGEAKWPFSWGRGDYGELGDGFKASSSAPVAVIGPDELGFLASVVQVTSGGFYSMAVLENGTAWSWGRNAFGVLGDGTTTDRSAPVQVKGAGGTGHLKDVVQVSGHAFHSVALLADGTVWAWGANSRGQLGDGTTVDRLTPAQVHGPGGAGFLDDVVHVDAGYDHALAVRADGTVWAWGANWAGALGQGTWQDAWTPVQVKGPSAVGVLEGGVQVSAGHGNSLAVLADGSAWAWGYNDHGKLGDGSFNRALVPVQVKGHDGVGFLGDVLQLSAGTFHSLALLGDGTVWAWGEGRGGKLGTGMGSWSSRTTPVQVKGPAGEGVLGDIVHVSAGLEHSLAAASNGSAWAWGENWNAQLGDGTTTTQSTPVRVRGPEGDDPLANVRQVAAGFFHSVALAALDPSPPAPTIVEIDVKPDSGENRINSNSNGKVPVAILSSPEFDAASMVNASSLTFGATGDEGSWFKCNADWEDVNGDGLLDLICLFYVQGTAVQPGDTHVTLNGTLFDGTWIQGTDTVIVT